MAVAENDTIKILHLEDLASDAELVERTLKKANIVFEKLVVDTKAGFEQALVTFVPDIILSDHSLPSFDSIRALKIVSDKYLGIPFILVTATVSEEFAVEVMKNGAYDYILKDRLQRLPNAVLNAIEKSRTEKERQKFLRLTIKAEEQFRHTLDNMLEGIQIHDFNWRYIYVNDALVSYSTYTREDLLGYTVMEKYPGIEQTDVFAVMQRCMTERVAEHLESDFVFPDGTKAYFELSIEPIPEGIFILSVDRTEQKKAKEKLWKVNRLYAFISAINQSIVHISNETELLDGVCNIAVEIGQFKIAYIGLLDEKEILHLMCLKGDETAARKILKFSGLDYNDPALSHLPTVKVLKTGMYNFNNDVQDDPAMKHWKEALEQHDIRANISLPIVKFGKIAGVFGLHSSQKNFFDDEEITLLREATGDISFALENFAKANIQKATEERLFQNEKRFRALVEYGADGVVIVSATGNLIYVSPSIERILGYTEEEAMRLDMFSLVHPDDLAAVAKVWEQVIASPGIPVPGQTSRMRHKDGTWRWLEATVTNMLHDPSVNGIIDNFRDVTEKIKAEEQLNKSEIFNRGVLNSLSSHISVVDGYGNIVAVNDAWKRFSVENGDITLQHTGVGSNYFEVCEKSYKQGIELSARVLQGLKDVMNAKTTDFYLEYPCHSPTERRWFGMRIMKFESDEPMVVVSHQDISERKRAEESLLLTQFAIDNAGDAIFWMTPDGNIVNVNEAACRMLGYKRKELIALSVPDIDPSYDRIRWVIHFAEMRQRGSLFFETAQQAKDGRLIPVEVRANYIKFGEVELNCAFVRNISERKKAEENLLKSETRLKEAQEIAHISNWEIDLYRNAHTWSDEMYRILGIDKEEVQASTALFLSFIHRDDADFVKKNIEENLDNLKASSYHFRFIRKDGALRYGYIERKFEFDNNDKPIRLYGILQDVTERKSAEEEREKMTADIIQRSKNLEQFAYIVSHNLRSPIANILGLSDILNSNISDDIRSKSQQYLVNAVEQLDIIVKDLNKILEVRFEITENKETIYLSELVSNIRSSIQNLIQKENVKIATDFSAIDKIATLKSYIHSIFYNLISNSIKYKQPGKVLFIQIKSEVHGGRIHISFKDNGIGIDLKRYGEKLFGLYKRFHLNVEGKGVGLFMVKTQVEVLGGSIRVKSEPNIGTEFIVELPL